MGTYIATVYQINDGKREEIRKLAYKDSQAARNWVDEYQRGLDKLDGEFIIETAVMKNKKDLIGAMKFPNFKEGHLISMPPEKTL